MTPLFSASVNATLSSARIGGGVAIAALIVLFLAQSLHWTAPKSRVLHAVLLFVSALFCIAVAVFITGRFLIID